MLNEVNKLISLQRDYWWRVTKQFPSEINISQPSQHFKDSQTDLWLMCNVVFCTFFFVCWLLWLCFLAIFGDLVHRNTKRPFGLITLSITILIILPRINEAHVMLFTILDPLLLLFSWGVFLFCFCFVFFKLILHQNF